MSFLESQSREKAESIFANFAEYPIPAIIISRGIAPNDYMVHISEKKCVPLFVSGLSTDELFSQITVYFDLVFSPQIMIHATMMDVYGVGILYTGRAGIGKSECALDLVERGHRLIADDVVTLQKRAGEVLIATSVPGAGHHIEIRGVGIVDIERLFGVRAIRMQKRIEIEVHLELWDRLKDYERLGIDETLTTFLGVEIPKTTIPISSGKNITAISEVIAMSHMLKVYGHHPAREFVTRMQEMMKRKESVNQYLESDYE
jgi:HPr kinase/phosphorylase